MFRTHIVYDQGCFGNKTNVCISGNRRYPALIEGKDLFLRGKMITEAVMADLVPKGLDRATDVVIAGASAGGLAVFLQVLQSHNCSIMGI